MRDTNSVDMLKADGIWDDWVSGQRGRQNNRTFAGSWPLAMS